MFCRFSNNPYRQPHLYWLDEGNFLVPFSPSFPLVTEIVFAYAFDLDLITQLELDQDTAKAGELQLAMSKQRECAEKRRAILEQIDVLSQQHKTLRKELKKTESDIARYKSMTTVLRRIPPQVLREIFLQSITTGSTGIPDALLSPPWTLLYVCKLWNQICLDYPALWANIYIDRPYSIPEFPNFAPYQEGQMYTTDGPHTLRMVSGRGISQAVRFLEMQLERSKDAGLHVVVAQRPAYDYTQPFWRILLPHMHRCSSLKAPRHVVSHTPLDHCARLKSLVIDCGYIAERPKNPFDHPQTIELFDQERDFIHAITSLPHFRSYAVHMHSGEPHTVTTSTNLTCWHRHTASSRV